MAGSSGEDEVCGGLRLTFAAEFLKQVKGPRSNWIGEDGGIENRSCGDMYF